MTDSIKENLLIILIPLSIFPFILLFVNVQFDLYQVNQTLFWTNLAHVTGSILGLVGGTLIVWQFILGIRFVTSRITNDVIWIGGIHKFLGIYGIFLVLLHPILELFTYSKGLIWLVIPGFSNDFEKYVSFGRFALIIMLIIWFTSALLRSKVKYRPWKYLHYLSYPLLILVFFHSITNGTFINKYPILKVYWYLVIILLVLLLIFKLFKYAGLGKNVYRVSEKQLVGNDVLLFSLEPQNKMIKPQSGQHCYIQISRFHESHPFSVMEYDELSGKLVFGVKSVGKFTKKILTLKKNDKIFLDGPYGVFTKEGQNSDPKVIIAGGIGITPFIELIKRYDNQNTYLFSCNRTLDETIYREKLIKIMGNRYIDCLSKDKQQGKCIVNGRINPGVIGNRVGKENLIEYKYFICGSPNFNKHMKESLRDVGISQENIFIEDFGF